MDLRFSGEIWHWRGPAPYHFVWVPPEECTALHEVSTAVSYGWGMIPVRARVGATVWETSLFPKDGQYVVPLKDAVRRAEQLEVGDTIAVDVTVALRDRTMPPVIVPRPGRSARSQRP
jgi:hypothetical protein